MGIDGFETIRFMEPTSKDGARISRLLKEETILRVESPLKKEELLNALIARICESYSLANKAELSAKIQEREKGISTTLETGLSIPHARVDGLNDFAAGLALVPRGLSDPRKPSSSIRLIFLFLSPNKREFYARHLQILREVSSFFQSDFIETLNQVSTAEALRLIHSRET